MANENGNGAPNGQRAPITEDELRRDETRWIAWLHLDGSRCAEALRQRQEKVGRLVEQFGLAHPRIGAIRRELQRFTKLTSRLFEFQFSDLDEP